VAACGKAVARVPGERVVEKHLIDDQRQAMLAAQGLQRLEVISDTFLSMSAPIQSALPAWLAGRAAPQQQIKQRLHANLAALDAILNRQTLVTRLEVEAGWYAVLRVPGVQPEEQTTLDLLLNRGVVVHPGGFYGFPGHGWLIVSLLPTEPDFRKGIEGIVEHFNAI
jgi:alanine-synthesizing transaminase